MGVLTTTREVFYKYNMVCSDIKTIWLPVGTTIFYIKDGKKVKIKLDQKTEVVLTGLVRGQLISQVAWAESSTGKAFASEPVSEILDFQI